jgi:hypothetical protein
LASSGFLAGTQSAANKGLNIPKQDVPDMSLETGDMSPLITKLSPQTNSEAIEQLELKALQ